MIIQFSHNGKEFNLSKRSSKNGVDYRFNSKNPDSGYRYWNNLDCHFRKFIKQSGWYLQKSGINKFIPDPKHGDLYFWGEWEPQSEFELTGNTYSKASSLPHAVHFPIFSTRGIGSRNTDPFVFGNNFYYTNCKQGRNKAIMLSLSSNSIILFGSIMNGDFVLDTVFVVDIDETVRDYKTHPQNYPDILKDTTINLGKGLADWHKLYKGKMYNCSPNEQKEQPETFCFVPCWTDYCNQGFARPVIDMKRFQLQSPIPVFNSILYQIKNYNETDFWNDLVKELITQGFSLGIKLEMPSNNDIEQFPEFEDKTPKCGGC